MSSATPERRSSSADSVPEKATVEQGEQDQKQPVPEKQDSAIEDTKPVDDDRYLTGLKLFLVFVYVNGSFPMSWTSKLPLTPVVFCYPCSSSH